jgi:hypothetical protein
MNFRNDVNGLGMVIMIIAARAADRSTNAARPALLTAHRLL